MDGFDLIVVPDADDENAADIFVDGAIGDCPRRFRLDTGAARTCIASDAETAEFPVVGTHRTGALFGTGASEELVTVPSIRVGPIVAERVTVARAAAVADLIGMDLLRGHRLHLRFDALRVDVDPEDPPAADFQPLRLDESDHPYVDIRFGTTIGRAVWDSGAGITIVDIEFARRLPHFFREAGRSRGTDASGARMDTPVFELTGAEIDGLRFPPHRVAGVDLSAVNATIDWPMDLVLGYSTLSLANWWLDFRGGRWAVTALPAAGRSTCA